MLPTRIVPNNRTRTSCNPRGWQDHPFSVAVWKSQPVMEWVESLAASTETSERNQGIHRSRISLDDVPLGEPVKATPKTPWILRAAPVKLESSQSTRRRALPKTWPKRWDLSVLQKIHRPCLDNLIRQLIAVALHIEALPAPSLTKTVTDNIQIIQVHFKFVMDRLLEQEAFQNKDENILAKAKLLETTAKKLQKIIVNVTNKKPTLDPNPFRKRSAANPSGGKEDLASYMTDWLRDNWINPYPDDNGLKEMAAVCGTTPTVISNWLINSRTRKWRPAIVKACEMGRPSGMLLEDSLALFDGKPIRSMDKSLGKVKEEEEDDNNNNDDDYVPPSKRIKRSRSASPLKRV